MFQHSFYYASIRKYVALVGTLFDDITITRDSVVFSANTADNETFNPQPNTTNTTEVLKVPITYANKDKMLARVLQDPTLNVASSTPPLPMMSFEMTGITYDSSRKLETTGRVSVSDPTSNSNLLYQYNPVPYNLGFRLSIFVKNAEDGTKILEHILPFFTPEWTTTCIMIPELNVREDVSVILRNVACEDKYDGSFTTRRSIIWDLDFTLKGKFYGPIKRGPIVEFIDLPISAVSYIANTLTSETITQAETADSMVQITPGLTTNGTPTSNASLSVNTYQINVNNDYGFITSIVES